MTTCATPVSLYRPTSVPVPSEDVPHLAEPVFHRHAIPVQPYRRGDRTLQSGKFTVEGTWNGVRVDQFVECGIEDGLPRARAGRIELEVQVHARARMRDGEDPRPSSTVRVGSRGRHQDGSRCGLTAAFTNQLTDEVTAAAGGEAVSPCPARDPTCRR